MKRSSASLYTDVVLGDGVSMIRRGDKVKTLVDKLV